MGFREWPYWLRGALINNRRLETEFGFVDDWTCQFNYSSSVECV